ncbi:LGFP repeat-containing protein [Streptomyces sp. NPDC059651]|uniref:LGFP repeat-containing protein n=1 Tax=unclassified Streptomyces TaxID=2593676 RepID=UPI003690EADE
MTLIDDKWAQASWLGAPVDAGAGSGEGPLPDGRGAARDYQNGSIYWSPQSGAHEVHGDIRVLYARHGGAGGFLGYPVTDELGTPDGVGRYNHFEGGSIYWTPRTGPHEVHGAIRDLWASTGWENGYLGYPVSDETGPPDNRASRFDHGHVTWTPAGGAVAHRGGTID